MFLAASIAARLTIYFVKVVWVIDSVEFNASSNCRCFFSWHFIFQAVVWVSVITSVGLAFFR